MFNDLNEDNFLVYALKSYEKPNCIMSEFYDDIKRIKYIKRLFKKYKAYNDLKERLILNHIILLYNVFGNEAATRILFYKIDKTDYDLLKTFLSFLNKLPPIIKGIRGMNIMAEEIPTDLKIEDILRKI